jgi:heme-degrading monooxygenase HmoA
MFVRLSTYRLPQERRADSIAAFRGAVDEISKLDGLAEAFFLVSDESDRAVTITVWDSHEAMTASRVRASRLRSDAAGAVGRSVESTEEFKVAVHAVRDRSAAATFGP